MALTTEEARILRSLVSSQGTGSRYGRDGRYDDEGYRRSDGRKKIMGYSREKQGATRGSNLDEFYARQAGAPSRADGPAFQGMTAEDIAADMKAHGERSGFGGVGKMPDRNLSPREQAKLGLDGGSPPSSDKDAFGLPYGPRNPRPDSRPSNAEFARTPIGGGGQPVRPVDPSTVRQSNPLLPPPKDASGNPASNSNPIAGTPAEFRQMSRDAQTGRTVTTSGATGLSGMNDPNADEMSPGSGGVRPMQAADFRRTISSAYGTGSNVTRQPGQRGGMMTDPLTGRQVPMKQALADQSAVQKTKQMPEGDEDFYNPAKLRQSMRRGRA